MSKSIDEVYKGKVRCRVCGLLIDERGILLLKHNEIGPLGYLWSPPGGGAEFGEDAEKTLIREFKEEVNLVVEVERFLFVNEYIDHRFHAIELFYHVRNISGELKLGLDPEMGREQQILEEAKFLTFEEIDQMDPRILHNSFRFCERSKDILKLSGYFIYQNN